MPVPETDPPSHNELVALAGRHDRLALVELASLLQHGSAEPARSVAELLRQSPEAIPKLVKHASAAGCESCALVLSSYLYRRAESHAFSARFLGVQGALEEAVLMFHRYTLKKGSLRVDRSVDLEHYFHALLRTSAFRLLTDEKRQPPKDEALVKKNQLAEPLTRLLRKELQALLHARCEALPADQLDVLRATASGTSQEAIASASGSSRAIVRRLLEKARAKLAPKLQYALDPVREY